MIIRGHRILLWLILQITTTITTMIIIIIITIFITILRSFNFRSSLLQLLLLLLYKTLHKQSPFLLLMLEESTILPNSMLSFRTVLMNPFLSSAFKRPNFLNEMLKPFLKISAPPYKIRICIMHIGVLTLPMLQ